MLQSLDLYIDLGTANTLIYGKGKGFLLNEPSVLAMRDRGRYGSEVFGVGKSAKPMLGKTPPHIQVERPLREGVIANFDATAKMLWSFLRKVKENHFYLRPRMIISLPCEVTEFEKKAVQDVGYSLGARNVYLLDEPVAAAIGSGLPVLDHRGQMIVDIGGGTTEIAVITLGGIVSSTAVRIGGNAIDEAIIAHIRAKYNFIIGEQTAEKIKIAVAQGFIKENLVVEIGGFDLQSGLPKKLRVSSQMIAPAVNGVLKQITTAIKKTLATVPPEIAGDIADTGITLAGGGALIHHMDALVFDEIGVPVCISEDPLFSVAVGGAKALENNQLFEALEKP